MSFSNPPGFLRVGTRRVDKLKPTLRAKRKRAGRRLSLLSWLLLSLITSWLSPLSLSSHPLSQAQAASPAPSPSHSVPKATGPLNPPSNLHTIGTIPTQAHIGWDDNNNDENGYEIYRTTTTPSGGSLIAITNADQTEFYDNSVTEGFNYFYRLRAVNDSGFSTFTGYVQANVLLKAPSSLTANLVNNGHVYVYWTNNSQVADTIDIEQQDATAGSGWSSVTRISSSASNYDLYYQFVANHTYNFRVRSEGAYNPSDYSNTANVHFGTNLANPTNVHATSVTSSQIKLAWNDPNTSGESAVRVFVSTPQGGQVNVSGDLPAYTTSFTYQASPSTNYVFYVYLADSTGTSVAQAASPQITTPAAQSVPSAPASLSVISYNPPTVTLSWSASGGTLSGYKVERATPTGAWTQIGQTGAGTTTYSDGGATLGPRYYYRVKAYNAAGDGGYSPTAHVDPPLPNPSGLNAVLSGPGGSVNLSWASNSQGYNGSGYKVERKAWSGSAYAEVGQSGAGVTSYSDSGATQANTTYYYRVRSYDGNGYSAYSNEAGVTTAPVAPPSLAVYAISATPTGMSLSWSGSPTGPGPVAVNGYRLERKLATGGSYSEVAQLGATTLSFTDTGLVEGTSYSYRVRATNAAGVFSAYSPEGTSFTAPNSPTNLTAQVATGTAINLSWNNPSTKATGFSIERQAVSGVGGNAIWTQIGTTQTTTSPITYQDSGLSNGTAYSYRVRAYVSGGSTQVYSAYTSPASATTTLPAPSGLTATARSLIEVDLSWTNTANLTTGVRVERKTGAGGTYTDIGAYDAHQPLRDIGLEPGITYYYRVRSHTLDIDSAAYSNEVSATTPASANFYVTQPNDDGTSNTSGTFSYALKQATSGQSIVFTVGTVTLGGNQALPVLRPGVVVVGSCGQYGPTTYLTAGTNLPSNAVGLTLGSSAGGNPNGLVYGLSVIGFPGQQIKALGQMGSSLRCVATHK